MSRKLDGVLEQMPEEMGRDSVKLLVEWITDETVPLDSNGYLTETRIVKAKGDGK